MSGVRGGDEGVLGRVLSSMRWFKGSLAGRISAVFLLAAAVTVAGILYALPRLERSLVEPREQELQTTLSGGVSVLQTLRDRGYPAEQTPAYIGNLYRISLLTQPYAVYIRSSPGSGSVALTNLSGSLPPSSVALDAARSGRRTTGTADVDGVTRVESAAPVQYGDRVVVLSVWRDIRDIEATVAITRRRVLVAGIAGASVALLLGIWVTTRLTRRLRALEAGARKIARGDFTASFHSGGSLELSRLARALDEMQEQLATLESARRRFIATASHELRTPLGALQGFLELLEEPDLEPERREEFVRHASDQAVRLSKLASDLLDLSRLDAGAVQVTRTPTDVGLLLQALLGEFRVTAERHGSELSSEVGAGAETANVDGDRVHQLLRAIVSNALGHTPEGTPIQVRARRIGGRALFEVADEGPGIPPARQREIFEPFSTSDETRGSGLGLAIARELARRMDGELTVASSPGSTVFTLSVPA